MSMAALCRALVGSLAAHSRRQLSSPLSTSSARGISCRGPDAIVKGQFRTAEGLYCSVDNHGCRLAFPLRLRRAIGACGGNSPSCLDRTLSQIWTAESHPLRQRPSCFDSLIPSRRLASLVPIGLLDCSQLHRGLLRHRVDGRRERFVVSTMSPVAHQRPGGAAAHAFLPESRSAQTLNDPAELRRPWCPDGIGQAGYARVKKRQKKSAVMMTLTVLMMART
jgi:hypothetical protein